jgi:hypothetical protein
MFHDNQQVGLATLLYAQNLPHHLPKDEQIGAQTWMCRCRCLPQFKLFIASANEIAAAGEDLDCGCGTAAKRNKKAARAATQAAEAQAVLDRKAARASARVSEAQAVLDRKAARAAARVSEAQAVLDRKAARAEAKQAEVQAVAERKAARAAKALPTEAKNLLEAQRTLRRNARLACLQAVASIQTQLVKDLAALESA